MPLRTTAASSWNPVIALDIGNVSMRLTFDEMYRRLDTDSSDPAAVARLWEPGAALETGRCTEAEFLDRLDVITGRRHTKQYLREAWQSGVAQSMPGMADAVRSLVMRGIRFSYMSDISTLHLEQVYRICEFRHLVTGGIFSFSAGAFKLQGPIMFLAFERRYGRPLAFFDDREEIIEHAKSFGWNAIRFQSPEQFLRDAEALL